MTGVSGARGTSVSGDSQTGVPESRESYRTAHLLKGSDYDDALAADDFDAFMAVREIQILVGLIPRLFPKGVGRYLDFACGTGRIVAELGPYASASYGVDVSASMVAVAEQKCSGTRFFLQDITREPLALDPVDLVTAFRFFGNAEESLRRDVLRALREILRPSGVLVLNNHRNPWSLAALANRVRGEGEALELNHKKLGRLLGECGFRVVRRLGVGGAVFRGPTSRSRFLRSHFNSRLESLWAVPGMAWVCPDAVVIAERV